MDISDNSLSIAHHFLLLFTIICCSLPSLCIFTINTISGRSSSPFRYAFATLLPMVLGFIGYKRKSLDISGLFAAIVVGFLLTFSNYCFSVTLIALFFTASSATKYRSEQKRKLEEDFKYGGQRNWIQVISNAGLPAVIALMYAFDVGSKEVPVNFGRDYNSSWLSMAILGALSCCSGDTFASELGPVLPFGEPRLITTFKRVPKGTNGGVSIAGLLASILGGFIAGGAYYLTLLLLLNHQLLYKSPPQWPIVLQGILCGLIGSLIDSYLGATIQFSGFDTKRKVIVEHDGPSVKHISGRPWLNNHLVNLFAGFFTAMLSPAIAQRIWPWFG